MEFKVISLAAIAELEFSDYEQKLTYIVDERDDLEPDHFIAILRISDTRYMIPTIIRIGIFPTRKEAEKACHKDSQKRASNSIN